MSINTRNNLNGWLVIDKPYNMGSTQVVSKLKWSLSPKKIGHAGTLDPLATGVLPIAFGNATKLIPFVMDGKKIYEFQITWGSETTTDDIEGKITRTSEHRPSISEIENILPLFIGDIEQIPPIYSALKVQGQRSYDLARSGQDVHLAPRIIHIEDLKLLNSTSDTATFRVICGKGTYVRSLGRDIGRKLGCFGHISMLRRLSCGPFSIEDSTPLSLFQDKAPSIHFLPLDIALKHLPTLSPSDVIFKRLTQGQRIPFATVKDCFSGSLSEETPICLRYQNKLFGLVRYRQGVIHPYRIFQLSDLE